MAVRLGPLFLRAALGPLNYASSCIMGRQVEGALRELTEPSLLGAVRRATETVAEQAGLRPEEVERLLPMPEVRAVAAEVAAAQERAHKAWQQHAGHVGGLLEGVADLTIDGRPPDLSLCLTRLARKVHPDKEWSQPLKVLADVAGRWTDLLYRCRDVLEEGQVLARAYESRRMRRLLTLVIASAVLASAAVVTAWYVVHVRGARGRVQAALGLPEICDWSVIDSADQSHMTEAQRATVEQRIGQCAERVAKEQREREEQRRREEEAREKERARKEHEQRCLALIDAVGRGADLGTDEWGTAGKAAALLQRVATGRLERADLAPPEVVMPCPDVRGSEKLGEAFAKAVLGSVGAWLGADDVSDRVSAILSEHKDELRPRHKSLFALQAEKVAKRALVTGDEPEVARALRLCALKRALEISRGSYCDALEKTKKGAP
jgi:hypothetical protein